MKTAKSSKPLLQAGLALARVPVQSVLSRLVQLHLPPPVQRFAQGTLRRVLRDFPLLGELLELSRVVIERATAAPSATGATSSAVSTPVSAAVAKTVPTSKAVEPSNGAGKSASRVAAAATAPALRGGASGTAPAHRGGASSGTAPALRGDLQLLLADLRGPSVEVAVAAVEALAASGDPAAREVLLATLHNAEGYFHPLVRVAALRAFASDDSESVRAALIASIASVSAEVSLAAIAVLTQQAAPYAVDSIKRVVDDRSGYFAPEVRAAAEQALTRLGG